MPPKVQEVAVKTGVLAAGGKDRRATKTIRTVPERTASQIAKASIAEHSFQETRRVPTPPPASSSSAAAATAATGAATVATTTATTTPTADADSDGSEPKPKRKRKYTPDVTATAHRRDIAATQAKVRALLVTAAGRVAGRVHQRRDSDDDHDELTRFDEDEWQSDGDSSGTDQTPSALARRTRRRFPKLAHLSDYDEVTGVYHDRTMTRAPPGYPKCNHVAWKAKKEKKRMPLQPWERDHPDSWHSWNKDNQDDIYVAKCEDYRALRDDAPYAGKKN